MAGAFACGSCQRCNSLAHPHNRTLFCLDQPGRPLDHGRGTTAQDEALGLLLKALHGLSGTGPTAHRCHRRPRSERRRSWRERPWNLSLRRDDSRSAFDEAAPGRAGGHRSERVRTADRYRSQHPRSGPSGYPSTNAGSVVVAYSKDCAGDRSSGLCPQRSAPAGVRVESTGVAAHGQIPLCARSPAGTL